MNCIVESLESRIAPASLVNPTTLVYTDVDGDTVTVKISKGDLTNKYQMDDESANSGVMGAEQLEILDLTDPMFSGATLTITSKQVAGAFPGDGFVNVGYINAAGVNLGSVKVDGDLGEIDAGDNTGVAIKKVEVQSMGMYGVTTGGNAGLHSEIGGSVDTFVVKGDVDEAHITADSMKALTIKGSLIGRADNDSGQIETNGGINTVKIMGDIRGGAGSFSGSIRGGATMVTIGGDVRGDSGTGSGSIQAASKIAIGGDVVGGNGGGTGLVNASSMLTIKGDLIGRTGDFSGVAQLGSGASLKIGGDVIGGAAKFSGQILGSDVKSIAIGGDVVGGQDIMSGTIFLSSAGKIAITGSLYGASGLFVDAAGGIAVSGAVKDISIKGSVSADNGSAFIIAQGAANSSAPAIGKLTIGGNVEGLDVLAGYTLDNAGAMLPMNGDASIGSVKVTGNWTGSNLVAGVETANTNTGFQTGDSALIMGHDPDIVAKIASITIGGQVMGQPASGYWNGFVAEQLPTIKVGKAKFAFPTGNEVWGIGSTYAANMGLNVLAFEVT